MAEALSLAPGSVRAARADVQRVMSDHVSILREDAGLRIASKQLADWHSNGTSVAERETANLLLCSRLVAASALARTESRGAHYRADFPDTSAPEGSPIILRRAP